VSGLRPVVERGGACLEGGMGSRRDMVAWASLSYSTEVLRGTDGFGRDEPEAHELLGLWAGCMSLAACVNAVAIWTEVSFTLHRSGLGGDVIVFGPPGRDAKVSCSRCFSRA
jgi:hypothetical protein